MIANLRSVFPLLVVLLTAACAGAPLPGTDDIKDPLETVNRGFHGVNKGVDRLALRPVSRLYGAVVPDGLKTGISNATSNLGLPSDVINHALQGDPETAIRLTTRFILNSTAGLAGLGDPATELGLDAEPTDFGQTLQVWGVGEGIYHELPLLGPATTRSAIGQVVDAVTDPVRILAQGDADQILLGSTALGLVDQRHKLRSVIEPVLDNSADSYAAARISYLQNRRRNLKGETDAEDLEDPFAFDE